ncbi:MAG: RNA 2',3'-cyclic phosphodiesterase [Nocardioides sp.]|uniref:RNA 2',3'-cyclic phosphodiesterase n=1 Tax=Nocardioides sp. TaxID=35761 RepID=UPI0039E50BB2
MRAFVAIVPPAEVIDDLDEFWEVRRHAGGFRWTRPEQFHVTLAFAPAVPDRAVEDWLERLGAAAGRRTPFEMRVAGGGAFPQVAEGRVLYAGLRDEPELARLATGVRNATATAGIEVDGGRFRPHLTLARLRRPTELTRWVRLADSYTGPAWRVDSASVVESHLGEGPGRRPRHEMLAEIPLG